MLSAAFAVGLEDAAVKAASSLSHSILAYIPRDQVFPVIVFGFFGFFILRHMKHQRDDKQSFEKKVITCIKDELQKNAETVQKQTNEYIKRAQEDAKAKEHAFLQVLQSKDALIYAEKEYGLKTKEQTMAQIDIYKDIAERERRTTEKDMQAVKTANQKQKEENEKMIEYLEKIYREKKEQ